MDPGWILAFVSMATVIAGIIAWLARGAWRVFRRFWLFIEDWEGKPAEPEHGRPERPGVMKRLAVMEGAMGDIRHEVHLNSGSSIRDVVQRTEAAVAGLQKSVNDISRQINGAKS